MRIKLIEDLPMATSAELCQLSWVIERLLADPRRIVQVRAQLQAGQPVQYLSGANGKCETAKEKRAETTTRRRASFLRGGNTARYTVDVADQGRKRRHA